MEFPEIPFTVAAYTPQPIS